jgi:hypothetical protein
MMKIVSNSVARKSAVAVTLAAGLLLAGCKGSQPAARTDQQVTSDIQAKIQGESALSNQNVQVSVANGIATLSGSVTDEASRALAGNDSGTVAGVKTVVNNLVVQPVPAQMTDSPAPAPQPAPVKASQPPARKPYSPPAPTHRPVQAYQPAPAPQPAPQMAMAPSPAPVQQAAAPAPPRPVVKTITLPAGTVLPIRVTEELDSKTAQSNDVFHGSLASDIGTQGVIAIPSGAPIIGRIVEAKDATHFAGSSLLSLELTQVTARGQKLALVTDPYSQQGAGRGKNTALKAGGGAVLGTIIGGLAGGGKGAVIGGLAGGAAGTGVNAATRGQQVNIPSETLINFSLKSPVTLTVTIPPSGHDAAPSDPQLQTR